MVDIRYAEISQKAQEEITRLEQQIKQETGGEVILVAYEKPPEAKG